VKLNLVTNIELFTTHSLYLRIVAALLSLT